MVALGGPPPTRPSGDDNRSNVVGKRVVAVDRGGVFGGTILKPVKKARHRGAYGSGVGIYGMANEEKEAQPRPKLLRSLFDSELKRALNAKSEEERLDALIGLLQKAQEIGIDGGMFNTLLNGELDRRLKKRFGYWFLVATLAFTIVSYGIIIANSIWTWGIPQVSITALIIETPLQFIGLLYIIARNLFPQGQAVDVGAGVRAGSRPAQQSPP
jgi:hypothetical protein